MRRWFVVSVIKEFLEAHLLGDKLGMYVVIAQKGVAADPSKIDRPRFRNALGSV